MKSAEKHNRDIKAILFDLDGTLLDTSPGIINSVKYTISSMGLHELSDSGLKEFIGPPIRKKMQEVYHMPDDMAEKAMNVFRTYYGKEDLYKAEVYDGMIDLLSELRTRGYLLGVATYKREDQARSLLESKDIASLFDVIHGSDIAGQCTKADVIKWCLNDLDVQADETILVGDSLNDAVGAQETGMRFIGVSYGFGFKSVEDIEKCDYYGKASSCSELRKIFCAD